jgi:hypothetical protein
VGSLGANLHPEAEYAQPVRQYAVFRSLQERSNVKGVYVAINEVMRYDNPGLDEQYRDWPYADHAYVVGTISQKDVEAAVAELQPDDVGEGWYNEERPPEISVEPGESVFCIWWD